MPKFQKSDIQKLLLLWCKISLLKEMEGASRPGRAVRLRQSWLRLLSLGIINSAPFILRMSGFG